MKRILKMTMVLLSLLILASCSFPGLASNTDEDTISITGGITSEAQILASLVAGMVEHYTDKNTAIINNLATTTINHQAMMNGDASISAARYTGTDLTTTLNLPPEKDPKKAFATVKDEFEKDTIKRGSRPMVLKIRMSFLFEKTPHKNTIYLKSAI